MFWLSVRAKKAFNIHKGDLLQGNHQVDFLGKVQTQLALSMQMIFSPISSL